jgi:hypothetical protein
MRIVQYILLMFLLFIKSEINAQLVTVFETDSLKIYSNKDGENVKPSVCKLKFVSQFNDSVIVCFDNKRRFSKFLKPDKSIASTDVDLSAPYIDLPLKNKKSVLKIMFVDEKITINSIIVPGYRYVYVYKDKKTISLYYRNAEISFY